MYLREASLVFHRVEDCAQLRKRPARGSARPLVARDLSELNFLRPCKNCYPDAPRVKVVRRFCPQCNVSKVRPCAHNGGVRVTSAYSTSYVGLLRDPGDEVVRSFWVWPDRAHFYEVAP